MSIPVKNPPEVSFSTRDLEHAVTLVVSGISFLGTRDFSNYKLFVFEKDPRIDGIIAKYIGGELLLPARELFRVWRDLRSLTFSADRGMR